MAELKTKENDASVEAFINAVPDEKMRTDSVTIINLMTDATGEPAKMWGDKIVGFGKYQYKSASTGKGGDWFVMGFAPRKAGLVLYLMSGYTPKVNACLARLGKHKLSGSCINIKRLSDVDNVVLKELIDTAAKEPIKYQA